MADASRYGVWEICLNGPKDGNPFTEQWVLLNVCSLNERAEVDGFYDGEGRYIARFMPSFEGEYRYELTASFLDAPVKGTFTVGAAEEGNHGVVRTSRYWGLSYDDGTPYFSIGTTCYVWELQSDELIEKTFETLKNSAFNKIRFCVFPKHYVYNLHEPRSYPFEGTPMDSSVLTKENFNNYKGAAEGNHWDFSRFNTAHFRHIENCIKRLGDMGIEADIILFHPYDRWGFSVLSEEEDLFYMRYVTARFAAFHNVWWSLANEYDLMNKSDEQWLRIAEVLVKRDPYRHMRSVHNCFNVYDFNRPWCTHCSIQHSAIENTDIWRQRYMKPVVLDEICYEGDIQFGWGNLTGEELLRRFWEIALRGGHPGHGETLLGHDDVLWWSHGGELHGESHKRFGFLRDIVALSPGGQIVASEKHRNDEIKAEPLNDRYRGKYFLYYFGNRRPSFREYYIDDDTEYEAYALDTWECTKTYVGTFRGKFRVELAPKPYMGVLLLAK